MYVCIVKLLFPWSKVSQLGGGNILDSLLRKRKERRWCPEPYRVFSSILGLCPLNSSNTLLVLRNRNASSHFQMTPRRQNHPSLRITTLERSSYTCISQTYLNSLKFFSSFFPVIYIHNVLGNGILDYLFSKTKLILLFSSAY